MEETDRRFKEAEVQMERVNTKLDQLIETKTQVRMHTAIVTIVLSSLTTAMISHFMR